MSRALRLAVALAGAALAVPVAIVVWEYLFTPVYDFPSPQRFTGAQWYNPYASRSASWAKANFHAHTIAWGGLTNGHQSSDQLDSAFRAMRFDVREISNYHDIDTIMIGDSARIPSYEYGYSIRKTHRLAIGARSVNWLDFPLWQSRHHKQYIIGRLRPTTALIAINHPRMRHGHTSDDFRWLANYDFVEALNPFGDSLEEWDSALSSGHAAWVLGDDDTHDIRKLAQLGVRWTMIATATSHADSVIAAIRAGRHYAVRGHLGQMDNGVRALTMVGDTLTIALERRAARIRFIGDSGRVLGTVADANGASWVATPRESYLRVEVRSDSTEFFMNPVVRWDGRALPQPRPMLNVTLTWLVRGSIALSYALVLTGAGLAWRRRRR